MNRKQLIGLWVGIVVIVVMGLFPPWTAYKGNDGECYMLHKFILFQPAEKNIPARIDIAHLFAQWIMVAVVTSGFIITFQDKRPKDEQKQ